MPDHQKLTPPQTYAKALYPLRRGCPLYIPESNEYLPESNEYLSAKYLENGTLPGDLGIVRPDGGFNFLLSIVNPAGHPINKFGVPEKFEPVSGLVHERKTSNVFPANHPILSAGARTTNLGIGGS